jgi:hypothetical protein
MLIVKDDHLQETKQHQKARKDNQEKVVTMKIGAQERTSLEGGQAFCNRMMMIAMHKEKATKQGKAQKSKTCRDNKKTTQ